MVVIMLSVLFPWSCSCPYRDSNLIPISISDLTLIFIIHIQVCFWDYKSDIIYTLSSRTTRLHCEILPQNSKELWVIEKSEQLRAYIYAAMPRFWVWFLSTMSLISVNNSRSRNTQYLWPLKVLIHSYINTYLSIIKIK